MVTMPRNAIVEMLHDDIEDLKAELREKDKEINRLRGIMQDAVNDLETSLAWTEKLTPTGTDIVSLRLHRESVVQRIERLWDDE